MVAEGKFGIDRTGGAYDSKAFTCKKHEHISHKNYPQFDEKWLQDRIAEDPAILGLGEVVVLDRERAQERAGRLDILLSSLDRIVDVKWSSCSGQRVYISVELGEVPIWGVFPTQTTIPWLHECPLLHADASSASTPGRRLSGEELERCAAAA